jgi:predicted porin
METWMKKAVLVAAVLAGMSAGALAQSNVQIYGVLDSAIVHESGGPKGSATKLESGVSNSSRIGFRGGEDLGDGLSALFVLEAGILIDTGASDQNGLLFGRQAFVGVRKNDFGTLAIGRQYTPIYQTLTMIDPSSNNYGGAAGQLMSGEKAGTRQNNAVNFSSDKFAGFSGQLAYGFGEVSGNAQGSRQVGGSLTYELGKLTLRTAYNQTNNTTATDSARNTLTLAKYDFGVLTAGVGMGTNKGTGTTDSRDYIAALTVPFGPHTIMATYIKKDDRSVANKFDAHQYASTYIYNLSKRTLVYAAYAKLSNINFTTTKFGTGNREIDLGIKQTF